MSHKELAEERDRKRGTRGRGGKDTGADSDGANQVDGQSGVPIDRSMSLDSVLFRFSHRDDGWLRFMPDGEGKFLYLKWKFTRGRYAGSYAFVSGAPVDYLFLLLQLECFIDDIYAGRRKPTPDSYYNA